MLGVLNSQLAKQQGRCAGFVLMPDHVHAVVWFSEDNQLSHFMKQWKQRSSVQIKRLFWTDLTQYGQSFDQKDAIWQPRYYDFNLFTESKLREKLNYMHLNPVRAGLCEKPADWKWSSAQFYEQGRSVGVPITCLGSE